MFNLKSLFAGAALSVLIGGNALAQRCTQFVFYGDSHARGLAAAAMRQGLRAEDLGINGVGLLNGSPENRSRLTGYLNSIASNNIVMVSLGANDFRHFVSVSGHVDQVKEREYFESVRNRLLEIRGRGGIPVILGLSVEDYSTFSQGQQAYLNGRMGERDRANRRLSANDRLYGIAQEVRGGFIGTTVGQNHDVPRADLPRTDGLHFRPEAYGIIVRELRTLTRCL